ncbi:fibronectin type-III domain-containing protein 3A isoform X2 [Bacillus rossius redtenbacheri]|uniref:fibronectin type-III domain-containing protein 3A isoform X2 n=1 Tax=Bacillus rossius redtenbacheri TaxID=93214 RepID=UPI002FDECA89
MLAAMVAGGQSPEPHNDMYCSQYEWYHQDYYSQQPEIQLCTLQGDYGPVTVPMVSSNSSPPMAMPVQVPPGHMVQQVVDENGTLRHVILSHQHIMPLPPPPYGPGAGSSQPGQQFYATQGIMPGFPPHFGHGGAMQPGVMGHAPSPGAPQGHSPPPHTFHKDERTHRQYIKLKRKLEQKQRGDGFGGGSQGSTPPFSPPKEMVNGLRRGKERGADEGEEGSSLQDEEEDEAQLVAEMLSTVKPPLVAELGSRTALLQWGPPALETKHQELMVSECDLRYEVLLSDKGKEGRYKSIYNGVALSCRIQDLRPGTEYSVCVQAHLEEFQGAASEPATFATAPCEPDPPQPPKVAQRGRTSLQLRWNAPVDNGSPIAQYVLECDDGGGWAEAHRTKGKQHNLTKLRPGACYKFRLAAVNQCGRSAFSDAVLTSTAGLPPEMPSPPVLKEATVTSLHLAWQKRPSDDDFTLQMDDKVSGHGFLPVYNGKEAHYRHHGLHRHSEYKFRLRAHNEEGSSRWSDEVCYRTLPDKPATPSRPGVKGRVHAYNFKIKWDPPSDKGGVDIAAYILELGGSGGFKPVYTGPDTEFVCDRLTPGTTYQLRVACTSVGGRSDYSEPCTVTTEAVAPGQCAPPWVQGKPRATSLLLKWGYPEYDGGAPLTEFEVQMTRPEDASGQPVYSGRDAECLVTDLSPGRSYLFQVRAANRIGAGPWSVPVEVVSGAAPPDAPPAPHVACRSPHHALVQWEEPASNGAPVLDYRLEMSTSESEADFSTVFHGLAQAHEVKGLAPATAYFFRVQASNSAGWSAPSLAGTAATPASPPAAVSLPRCAATSSSLALSWPEPACHGADILHYVVDAGERLMQTPGPARECRLEGLQPDTTYRLRVQAVNSVGPGPFSPVLRATTLRTPPPPPRLELVNAYHNYLKLKWGDGKNADFTRYVVEMEGPRSREFQMVYQGTSLSCKVNRLQELTTYRFRVAAVNDAGQGDYSDVQEYATTITPPPPPKAPKVTETQLRGCSVEWAPCRPVGGDAVLYQVQLARCRDQDYQVAQTCDEPRAQLSGLEPGTDYLVRVCPVRRAASGLVAGAASPSTAFCTAAAACPVASAAPRSSVSQAAEWKPLTDQQKALIILAGFTVFAVLVAAIVQHILPVSSR